MWVVKLGGSLQGSDHLRAWLNLLANHGHGRVVLVPGGGLFADQIRHLQVRYGFDDKAAHKMALLAMERYAHLLCSLETGLQPVFSTEQILHSLQGDKLPVWLPYGMVSENADIPASWSVTSDSLALWLAGELGAESLFLIKAAALPGNGLSIEALSRRGLVDGFFPPLARRAALPVVWFRGDEYAQMEYTLSHNTLPAAARVLDSATLAQETV